jgi:hypothetical protein
MMGHPVFIPVVSDRVVVMPRIVRAEINNLPVAKRIIQRPTKATTISSQGSAKSILGGNFSYPGPESLFLSNCLQNLT